MPAHPMMLSPATPSELLDYMLARHSHPTTLLVCWSKKQFLDALVEDVEARLVPRGGHNDQHHRHALLGAPLMQVAVSRHIAVVFIPTVTHLRSYLAAFFACDSKTPPPPLETAPSSSPAPPLLLVYGLVELHRDGTEWSAQGLNTSAAGLVESAARNGLRAALVEPRKTESRDELGVSLGEGVPILSGSKMGDDGTWSGRVVPVGRVLGRWFEVGAPTDSPDA